MYRLLLLLIVVFASSCTISDNSSSNQRLLSVSITLDNLPNSINYNKASTPDGFVEYEWGVTFDINGDGVINQGDIVLRILHFKAPGSMETTGVIEDLNADLWLYTNNTQTTTVANASFDVNGDTITITINKNAHDSLDSITDSTLVNFESSTYDSVAGFSKYDYHPAFDTLVNIPVDGQFTDPQGDADFDYIDMVSMSLEI